MYVNYLSINYYYIMTHFQKSKMYIIYYVYYLIFNHNNKKLVYLKMY